MTETLLQALKGTPWWVYVLLVYLLFIGKKTLKPHSTSFKTLILLPIILTAWNFIGKPISLFTIFFWLFGICLGLCLIQKKQLQIDPKKKQIHFPGSRTYLLFLMTLFSMKYTCGYLEATHQITPDILLISLTASSFISGVFLGRFLKVLYLFKKIEPIDL